MGEVKDEGRVGVRSDNRPKHHKQPRRRGQEPGLGTGRGAYSEGFDMLVLIGVSILRLALRRLLSVVVGVSISLSSIRSPFDVQGGRDRGRGGVSLCHGESDAEAN